MVHGPAWVCTKALNSDFLTIFYVLVGWHGVCIDVLEIACVQASIQVRYLTISTAYPKDRHAVSPL